jgi:hypothetical protein
VICILSTQGSEVCTESVSARECSFPPYLLQIRNSNKNTTAFRTVGKTRELTSENLEELRMYATAEELTELAAFQEFLARYVKPHADCAVQCMLLWAEWVRYYKKTTREFPALILEKNFMDLVTRHFDLMVSEDDWRGFVFPGIKFVA